jgi:hypothetical protein
MSCACARVWVLARAPGMAPASTLDSCYADTTSLFFMIGAIVCATCERAARGMLHLPDGELTGPKFEIQT